MSRTVGQALTIAAVAKIGGAGLLHAGRLVRLRNRAAVSAVTLAPVSLLPAAAAELVLLARRRWALAGAGAVVLAGCAATHVAPFRRTRQSVERQRRSDLNLTVMTANLLYGRADPDVLARRVVEHDVDVLCVQEVHQDALDAIADRVRDRLPHRHDRPGVDGDGAGIFSRYPLTNRSRPTGFGFPPVMADLTVPVDRAGGTRRVSLVSFHSKAPVGRGSVRFWSGDLARLGRLMSEHPGSLIVAGDFNATREHRQFRDLLTGGFTDAADDTGAGLAFTFPDKRYFFLPVASLDHVVLGRGLVGLAVRTVTQPGSDHRAVIATVAAG